jgi:crotonobetainyl-CoA:carnitine CoA-transferase CaiB-like acyl-CoA transferase
MDTNYFKGYKVVELASVLAGPSVGMFFAEMGAEVIKIENKTLGGDITRNWKLASERKDHPFSAYYASVNWGKISLFLNLKEKNDYLKLLGEIKTADVVIVNYKADDAKKLGVDFKSLKAINPNLIYGEITGFGEEKRIAYDIVLQAESGFISMNGKSKGEEVKIPIALIDLFAAHQLKEGILVAIIQNAKKKRAAKVSVSLYDSAIAALANQATNWLMGKYIPQPIGTLHPNIAPYGERFRCKDGKELILAIGSDKQFSKLCNILKEESISSDEKFATNQNRIANRVSLDQKLKVLIEKWNADELLQEFIENNIPAGILRDVSQVFEVDKAKALILEEVKEGEILKTISGNAFRISR